MIEEMPQGYNIGWEAVGAICVTTGAVPRSGIFGGYSLQYETLMWDWDGEKRGLIRQQIIHPSEKEAIKVHGYIVGNLKEVNDAAN